MAWKSREIGASASRNPISSGPLARPQRAEVRALTGLRGVAALLVALYHINPNLIAPTAAGRFVGKGYLWVDLFFVLSGFLLAMNYASRFAGGWKLGAWLDFLLHRIARIYPLYLVLVVASVGYSLLLYGGFHATAPPPALALPQPARDVAANLLMVQSWGLGESIDGATVARQDARTDGVLELPGVDVLVRTTGKERLAIRREGERTGLNEVALEDALDRATLNIPHHHALIRTARCQPAAIP